MVMEKNIIKIELRKKETTILRYIYIHIHYLHKIWDVIYVIYKIWDIILKMIHCLSEIKIESNILYLLHFHITVMRVLTLGGPLLWPLDSWEGHGRRRVGMGPVECGAQSREFGCQV